MCILEDVPSTGQKLRAARLSLNWTQQRLADEMTRLRKSDVRVLKPAISRMESRDELEELTNGSMMPVGEPRLPLLRLAARALQAGGWAGTVADLLGE